MSPVRPPAITVLCGGLGGARLALATIEAGMSADVTFITNVADDWTVGGLPICPDTDAVLYALSDRFDEQRGWGIAGDRFPGPGADEPAWFGIGELDRMTQLRRRELLDSGASLADAIAALATTAHIDARVIPVTGDLVRTRIRRGSDWYAFQEWMVRDHGPAPDEVRYEGVARALPSAGAIGALVDAELVVIASSSPVASIAPILAIDGVRDALLQRRRPTLGLSPVVLGRPLAAERDRHRESARRQLMSAVGIDHTPSAVAAWLAPLVSHFAIDPSDVAWVDAVEATGAAPMLAPVIGIDADERAQLMELFAATCEWSRHSPHASVSAW